MSDYLSNLAARALDRADVLRPRPASRFEPPAFPEMPYPAPPGERGPAGEPNPEAEEMGISLPGRGRRSGRQSLEGVEPRGIAGVEDAVPHAPGSPGPTRSSARPAGDLRTGQVNLEGQSSPPERIRRSADAPFFEVERAHRGRLDPPGLLAPPLAQTSVPDGQPEPTRMLTRLAQTEQVMGERTAGENSKGKIHPLADPILVPVKADGGLSLENTRPDRRPAIEPVIRLPGPPALENRQSPAPPASMPMSVAAPAAAPTIQVTIGRIEIRATPPPTQPVSRREPPAKVMSLEEYLKRRNGGER